MSRAAGSISRLVLCCALLGLTACGDERDPVSGDGRFLTLDGGGPLAALEGGGAKQDKKATGRGTLGKFCNRLSLQGGKTFTMTLKLGGATLSAKTGACSACKQLAVGGQTLQVYAEGQYLGQGKAAITKGNHYVFWSAPQGQSVAIRHEALKPSDKQTCSSYMPK